MKRYLYFFINIVLILIAGLFTYNMINETNKIDLIMNNYLFISTMIMVLFAYVLKFFRIYLILIERRLPLKIFIKMYLKTTFINLALPFKMGEVFKVYFYGEKMNDYKRALLAVLTDRYFDTIALIILVLPIEMMMNKSISVISLILLIFFMTVTIIYYAFPISYKYLNKYLILNISSSKGIMMLKMLEKINVWYEHIVSLMAGRVLLLFLLSFFAWLIEYAILLNLAIGLNIGFAANGFINYLNAIFLAEYNELVSVYVCFSVLIFAIITVSVYGFSYVRGWNKDE